MPMFCRALVTEPGAHSHTQDDLGQRLASAVRGLPDPESRRRLIGFIHAQSGIHQRHVEADLDEAVPRPDWIQLVNRSTVALGLRTLADLRTADPEGYAQIDAFVVVTTSWVGFPSASRMLQEAAKIPLHAACFDVSGLGCAGPTHGMQLATALLDQGYQNVCLLFVDTMATWGLCRAFDVVPPVNEVVAQCLASDGAGAMLFGREPGSDPVFSFAGVRLTSRLWPDSLDQNDMTACPAGSPYLSVGKDIRTRLVPEAAGVFDADVIEHALLLHPGGPDLMKRLLAAVPALEEPVDVASHVLSTHGNLGSASVLFVLQESRRRSICLAPRFHLFALGPGIVTSLLRVEGVEM